MSGKVLLFGFDTLPAILAVEAAAKPFGAEIVPVARGDYGKSLAVLAGLEKRAVSAGGTAGAPVGRMMVLCGLEDRLDALLEALRQAGVGQECLKAVLTPHNRKWSAVKLYGELQREHQALRRGGGR